jgi:RNA polymerase sigma factor (TIGR02999 family)
MHVNLDITGLIEASRNGEAEAEAQLYAKVYDQLKRIARRQLQRQLPGHTLSTTALGHEAYERLAPPGTLRIESRAHFLALSARAMRQIMVDHARRRGAQKRGGPGIALPWHDSEVEGGYDPAMLVALDQRLTQMESLDPRLVRLVELRSFAGMELDEIADLLGVNLRTAQRDWKRARAWLSTSLV